MANYVKCRFSLNLQLFSIVLKSAPVKYIATYCPWDSHQIHSSCTSMSLWWQNNPSLWLSWTVSIPKWVPILRHTNCAPSGANLLEGGVYARKTVLAASDQIHKYAYRSYQIMNITISTHHCGISHGIWKHAYFAQISIIKAFLYHTQHLLCQEHSWKNIELICHHSFGNWSFIDLWNDTGQLRPKFARIWMTRIIYILIVLPFIVFNHFSYIIA